MRQHAVMSYSFIKFNCKYWVLAVWCIVSNSNSKLHILYGLKILLVASRAINPAAIAQICIRITPRIGPWLV